MTKKCYPALPKGGEVLTDLTKAFDNVVVVKEKLFVKQKTEIANLQNEVKFLQERSNQDLSKKMRLEKEIVDLKKQNTDLLRSKERVHYLEGMIEGWQQIGIVKIKPKMKFDSNTGFPL